MGRRVDSAGSALIGPPSLPARPPQGAKRPGGRTLGGRAGLDHPQSGGPPARRGDSCPHRGGPPPSPQPRQRPSSSVELRQRRPPRACSRPLSLPVTDRSTRGRQGHPPWSGAVIRPALAGCVVSEYGRCESGLADGLARVDLSVNRRDCLSPPEPLRRGQVESSSPGWRDERAVSGTTRRRVLVAPRLERREPEPRRAVSRPVLYSSCIDEGADEHARLDRALRAAPWPDSRPCHQRRPRADIPIDDRAEARARAAQPVSRPPLRPAEPQLNSGARSCTEPLSQTRESATTPGKARGAADCGMMT